MSSKAEEWARMGLLFLIALVAFSYFNRDKDYRDHSVESRMAMVKAMVEERRFEIDSFHSTIFYTSDKAQYGGHYYSDKAIGVQLIGATVYQAVAWIDARTEWDLAFRYFRDLITILTIPPVSAWIAPLLYLLIRRVSPSFSRLQASLLALALPFGTPYFKYSTMFYGHAIAGLFLLGVVYIWFVYRKEDLISWPRIFLAGLLLGWMVLIEYPTVILAGAAGLYILFVLRQKGRLGDWRIYALLTAGALVPLSYLLAYNASAFGSPLALGYGHEANPRFSAEHGSGLFGVGWPSLTALYYMTIHPAIGIFWQSPLLLLALPGWYFLFRRKDYRPEAWFSLLSSAVYIIFMSGYYMWWGYSFTPRHIIPVFPLFAFALSALPRKFFPLVVIAAIASIPQMLVVAAANPHGLAEILLPAFDQDQIVAPPSIIFSVYVPNLMNGSLTYNLGERLFQLEGYSSLIPFFVVESLLIGGLFILRGRNFVAEAAAPAAAANSPQSSSSQGDLISTDDLTSKKASAG